MRSPQNFYQKNKEQYLQLAKKFNQLNKRFSILRLLWFLLWFLAIWYTTRFDVVIVVIVAIIGLIGFVILVILHQKILAKKRAYEIYLEINNRELAALKHDFSAFESGEEFIEEQHFYTHDLDVFGSFSLFQFLNRTFSKQGKKDLANRLQQGFYKKETIEKQQQAVEELSKNSDFLQKFQVLGIQTQGERTANVEALKKWGGRQGIFKQLAFKIGVVIIPLLSWLMFYGLIVEWLSFTYFTFYLIIPLGFSGMYANRINKNHNELSKQTSSLQRWQLVFQLFEKQKFQSEAILDLQNKLKTEDEAAGIAIKKLSSLAQAFDTRLNLLGWVILNYFFSWDILQSIRLEIWRKKYGSKIEIWFQSLANMETLVSLGIFKFNHPQMTYPKVQEEGFVYQAQDVAHPLMPETERIANEISFKHLGEFTIVTGANMAGKSTYLRTVGANLILAMAGAPVCAKEMYFTPIQLFTSIRTKDSLAKNQSYFYAELLRLQAIIDRLKEGRPLFIILDEILKGTNSKDKEMGSKALVKQLIKLKAVGVIATHDLQLGELIKTFPENVQNRCFEVDIKNDELYFDYKLRQGISQNLNATFLMKKMGITG